MAQRNLGHTLRFWVCNGLRPSRQLLYLESKGFSVNEYELTNYITMNDIYHGFCPVV